MDREIIIDTSAIFAFLDPDDLFHAQATETYYNLLSNGDRLFTNSYVLVESSALIHRRMGFAALRSFLDSVHGRWDIQWITRSAHDAIWQRMSASGGSRLSFVDWSVIVMAEQTRSAIFTFDSDFASEGLTVIPARAV